MGPELRRMQAAQAPAFSLENLRDIEPNGYVNMRSPFGSTVVHVSMMRFLNETAEQQDSTVCLAQGLEATL